MTRRLYLRLFYFEDVMSRPRRDSTQCPQPRWGHAKFEGPSHAGPEAHDALRVGITVTTRRRFDINEKM